VRAADAEASSADRRSLRLALIVNLYPPYVVGGNEILARDVVLALRERGHTVHVVTGRGRELPRDGFTHGVLDLDLDRKQEVFLGGLPLNTARALRWHLYHHASYVAARSTLARLAPQLVVAWNLYGASMAPLRAARQVGCPVAAQPADRWLLHGLHDLAGIVPAVRALPRLGLRLVRGLLQPALARVARPHYVLAISDFIRRLHLEAGYPPAQTATTFLGVPIGMFPAVVHRAPRGRPWQLVFAGQLWEGKGPHVAVEAVARLRAQGRAVELDIFGSGSADFLAFLERLIADQGLAGAVRLRGHVARESLAEEYSRRDLFLFCSSWEEPFSQGLLEAQSTGLPAVATRTGGTPEAIDEGRNGLLVPPADAEAVAAAVARLMDDSSLYERLGRQAAADVRDRWGFEQYVSRLEAAYAAIVAGHGPGRRARLVDVRTGDPVA
jgi:glycosyltransferase involved in cell wall biosynthesis